MAQALADVAASIVAREAANQNSRIRMLPAFQGSDSASFDRVTVSNVRMVAARRITELEHELKLIESSLDEWVREFADGLSQLIAMARREKNPIVFV
jgi:hypothetical protein